VLVRKPKAGISLGGGRFSRRAAEALVRHDHACWVSPDRLRITGAGRAHQRRRAASEGETFLAQHLSLEDTVVDTDRGAELVRRDAEESPLDWLRRRKDGAGRPFIDDASYGAGERLRRDITLAGLLPGVTARFDAPKGSGPAGPGEATEQMVAARQRIRNAFEAVGADFADLLIDLCGFLKSVALIERERSWPARSAKVVIALALARLAEHYGIETAARGPRSSRGIRSWQAVVIEGGKG
jgi:hypothetical protein